MAGVYYAHTRALDPVTGDVRLSGGQWVVGSPAAELVLQVLRTPKGTYLPDPSYGIDLSAVTHDHPNVTAKLHAAITAALRHLVEDGFITDLLVKVQRSGRGRLGYDVSFYDPRAQGSSRRRENVTGGL